MSAHDEVTVGAFVLGDTLGVELGLLEGEVVGLAVGLDEGPLLGAVVAGEEVGLELVGLDEGLIVVGEEVGLELVGLVEGLIDVDGGLLIVGEDVVNSNNSFTSVKCVLGKLPLLGQTLSKSISCTPAHSAKGTNTASQLVVGIIRPLPRDSSPSSVKFPG